jgi:hypothetical protein
MALILHAQPRSRVSVGHVLKRERISWSRFYGGDFFGAERSEWDSATLLEHRSDGEKTRRVFEEANPRYGASK